MDYKLVAKTDIEHLTPEERTHQFHAAQIALKEENDSHAAKVRELEGFIWEMKSAVGAFDLQPHNAAGIQQIIRSGKAPDAAGRIAKLKAAKNPASAGTASPAA
jgi:hypothetical protein